MKRTVLEGAGMTPEEHEEISRKMFPDWFDKDGKRLPSAISGHRAPGGIYIPILTNKERGRSIMPGEQDSNIPRGWKPTLAKPIPCVRCMAKNKNGTRCGRWSVRGIEYCIVHGGKRPQMQKKAEDIVTAARMQLFNMTEDAAKVLGELLKEGTSDAIRLKAAQDVLDRAGLKSAIDVNVEVEHRVAPSQVVAQRLQKLSAKVVEDPEDSEEEDEPDFFGGLVDGSFLEEDEEVVDAELEE